MIDFIGDDGLNWSPIYQLLNLEVTVLMLTIYVKKLPLFSLNLNIWKLMVEKTNEELENGRIALELDSNKLFQQELNSLEIVFWKADTYEISIKIK